MPTPVTEFAFFPLKPNTPLNTILPKITELFKRADGFHALHVGPLVEDENIYCAAMSWHDKAKYEHWAMHDPDSYDSQQLFLSLSTWNAEQEKFEGDVGARILWAEYFHPVDDALGAEVTEIAFFSLPSGSATREFVIEKLGADSDISAHPVMTVGKAKGGAIGWVYKGMSLAGVVEEGSEVAFTGVFGYDSVEDHWTWRATKEHGELMETSKPVWEETGLKPVDIFGKQRSMFEGSGMVHARFTRTV